MQFTSAHGPPSKKRRSIKLSSIHRNILLTGATGFLGSALVRTFLNNGDTVSILKRNSSSLKRLQRVLTQIDVFSTEEDGLEAALTQATPYDVIIHAATTYGNATVPRSEIINSNLVFPVNLIESALKVHTSPLLFLNVDTCLPAGLNDYSLSKFQFTEWCKRISSNSNMSFLNTKLQHFYGPEDSPKSFPTWLISECLKNTDKIPLTNGNQRRDFIFIEDVCTAFRTLTSNISNFTRDYWSEIEIGSGKSITVGEFAEKIKKATNSKSVLEFGKVEYRNNEPMFLEANPAQLSKLGWVPKFDLDSGLTATINYESQK